MNKIYHCDVLEGLRKLKDQTADIIIADPPYNIGKDFGENKDNLSLEDYIHWSELWIQEATRVLKPTGTLFIYGFSEILAHLFVRIPLQKRWLIWHYTNKNVASLHFWQRSHESILCCWKEKPIFHRDNVREPYTETFLKNAAGKKRKETPGRFSNGKTETTYTAHELGALPRDVLKVPALAGGAGAAERWFLCKTCNQCYLPQDLSDHQNHTIIKHPTQKPLELTRRLIQSCKPEKDGLIIIPFVGSGSECLVAEQLGLSTIGFELNKDFVTLAQWVVKLKN